MSGDRGAPAWQQGSPGLSQLARSRSPSGGRGSRPRPARVGAPPAPPAAGRARGSEGQAAASGSGQRRPGASLTFVALQHILVRLHELLLLATVGRLLTRHVAGHGCPRRALPGPRGAPAPGPRAEAAAAAAPASAFVRFGGGGGSLGSLALGSASVSPGPAVALGSSARSHPARSRSAGPGSRFRLPTPRLRSSLSPPRRDGGGGASCQERQAGPVPRPSALRLRRRARLSPRPQPTGPGGPPTTARAGRGRERGGEQAGPPTGGPGSVRTRGPAGGSSRETPGPTRLSRSPTQRCPTPAAGTKAGATACAAAGEGPRENLEGRWGAKDLDASHPRPDGSRTETRASPGQDCSGRPKYDHKEAQEQRVVQKETKPKWKPGGQSHHRKVNQAKDQSLKNDN